MSPNDVSPNDVSPDDVSPDDVSPDDGADAAGRERGRAGDGENAGRQPGRGDDFASSPVDPGALDEAGIATMLAVCRDALSPSRDDLCSADARRAALDVFLGRPEGQGILLDVLYDSVVSAETVGARGVTPPPARTIRWGKGEVALDMQVRRTHDGSAILFVALQPPPRPVVRLVVRVKPQETARRATFDATGSAEVRLPARAECFWASVHGAAGEMYRIGTTPIDPIRDAR